MAHLGQECVDKNGFLSFKIDNLKKYIRMNNICISVQPENGLHRTLANLGPDGFWEYWLRDKNNNYIRDKEGKAIYCPMWCKDEKDAYTQSKEKLEYLYNKKLIELTKHQVKEYDIEDIYLRLIELNFELQCLIDEESNTLKTDEWYISHSGHKLSLTTEINHYQSKVKQLLLE